MQNQTTLNIECHDEIDLNPSNQLSSNSKYLNDLNNHQDHLGPENFSFYSDSTQYSDEKADLNPSKYQNNEFGGTNNQQSSSIQKLSVPGIISFHTNMKTTPSNYENYYQGKGGPIRPNDQNLNSADKNPSIVSNQKNSEPFSGVSLIENQFDWNGFISYTPHIEESESNRLEKSEKNDLPMIYDQDSISSNKLTAVNSEIAQNEKEWRNFYKSPSKNEDF